MSYSQLYMQNKARIPVPLAIVLVAVFGIFFARFFLTGNAPASRASKKTVNRFEVTNVSPYQANIFWQSGIAEEGYVFYGETVDGVRNIALDDRDVSESKNQYLNHYVTLRNLKPGTPYFFKIVSKNEIIVKPDGSLFSFKTPMVSSSTSALKPANGKILKENLTGQDNAIVILYINGMYPLSAMTKSTGEWLIPLNAFYDMEKLEGRVVSDIQKAKIEAFSEDGKSSVLNGRLSSMSPVTTTIVIGKSYELTDTGSQVLSAQTKPPSQKEIDIIYPIEGALIPGRAPLIKGAARPKSQVSITVNSKKTYTAVVTADLDGLWSYALPESLELGNHTITIKTKDGNGQEVTLTRKFVIIANDYEGKVLGEASGSPTLAVTATPAPTSTIVPSLPATNAGSSITPTALLKSGITDALPAIGGISFIVVGLGLLLVF